MTPTGSANRVWVKLLERLLKAPEISPRGIECREIISQASCIDMNYPIIDLTPRNIKYAFLYGEAWWILSGSNKVEDIVPYMKNIKKFSDNGIHFRGAYGPKVVDQLDYVIETLRNDPDSRQALMTIWNRNPRPSKDIPCTVSLQFLLRDAEVHCVATMRSSDIWLGYVYDVFNFSMIARYISLELEAGIGMLHFTAGSQHLYEHDIEKAELVANLASKGELYRSVAEESTALPLEYVGVYSGEGLVQRLKMRADGYLGNKYNGQI